MHTCISQIICNTVQGTFVSCFFSILVYTNLYREGGKQSVVFTDTSKTNVLFYAIVADGILFHVAAKGIHEV